MKGVVRILIAPSFAAQLRRGRGKPGGGRRCSRGENASRCALQVAPFIE